LLFAFISSFSASAGLIEGTFSGYLDSFVDYGEEDKRQNEEYNGQSMFNGAFAKGDVVTGRLAFYSEDIPADYLGDRADINYYMSNKDWFSFVVTIAGQEFDISRYFANNSYDDLSFQNELTFAQGHAIEQFAIQKRYSGETELINSDDHNDILYQSISVFFSALGDEDFLNTLEPVQNIEWQENDFFGGSMDFDLQDYIYNPDIGSFDAYKFASFGINLTEFTYGPITAVPEPSGFAILFLALFLLVLNRKKVM